MLRGSGTASLHLAAFHRRADKMGDGVYLGFRYVDKLAETKAYSGVPAKDLQPSYSMQRFPAPHSGSFTPRFGAFLLLAFSFGFAAQSGAAVDGFSAIPNGAVQAVVAQADGNALVAGNFTAISTIPQIRLARVLTDGAIDGTFTASADGLVRCLAVQPDGKILVGGDFTMVGGVNRGGLAQAECEWHFGHGICGGHESSGPRFASAGGRADPGGRGLHADRRAIKGAAG